MLFKFMTSCFKGPGWTRHTWRSFLTSPWPANIVLKASIQTLTIIGWNLYLKSTGIECCFLLRNYCSILLISHSLPPGLISTTYTCNILRRDDSADSGVSASRKRPGVSASGKRPGGGWGISLVILGIAIADRSTAKTKPIKELILHSWKMSALSNKMTVLYPAQIFCV